MTPNNVMIGVLCASPSTFHPLVCLSDLVSKTNDNVILKVAHGLTQKCKFRVKMTLSAKHMDLHGFHMDFIPASKNPKGQAHPTKKASTMYTAHAYGVPCDSTYFFIQGPLGSCGSTFRCNFELIL